jgi:hypothetical protein
MRTKSKLLLGALIVFLLSLLSGAAWLYAELGWAFERKPPDSALPVILRGLYGDVDQARQRFRQRVHQRFASGTDADSVRTMLERDVFRFAVKAH